MKLATLVECFPRPIIDPSLSLLLSLSKTASGGVDGAFPLARLVAFGATKPEGGMDSHRTRTDGEERRGTVARALL